MDARRQLALAGALIAALAAPLPGGADPRGIQAPRGGAAAGGSQGGSGAGIGPAVPRGHEPVPTATTVESAPARRAGLVLEQDAEREKTVQRATAFIASRMGRDGAYELADAENPAPIAVTALATLALLADGNVPGRGPRGSLVERGIAYLVNKQQTSGPASGYIVSEGDNYSKMHGHGFATLALAEVYGMQRSGPHGMLAPDRLRDALTLAVRRIEQSQEADTGGWYYDPVPTGHEGSVTICVVQALRAARNAGITVDTGVIDRAIDYVRRSQKPDGSFRYALGRPESTTALTAAAIATLNATGEYDSDLIRRGIEFLQQSSTLTSRVTSFESRQWPHYERLYLAQAYYQNPKPELFADWFRAEYDALRVEQRDDGSWSDTRYGAVYATAMNTLVLLLPYQYLPIFQR